jgi:DNA-binding winged helix-turn-helix (wHTH) protein
MRAPDEILSIPILTFGYQQDAPDVAANVTTIVDASAHGVTARLEYDGIVLDRIAQWVTCDGKDVPLAHAQFRLLEYFLSHPGRVLSRHELFTRLWGGKGPVGRRIDVYVASLRKLLADQGGRDFFRPVRGIGYIFAGKKQRRSERSASSSETGENCLRRESSGKAPQTQFWLDHATNSLRCDNDAFPS